MDALVRRRVMSAAEASTTTSSNHAQQQNDVLTMVWSLLSECEAMNDELLDDQQDTRQNCDRLLTTMETMLGQLARHPLEPRGKGEIEALEKLLNRLIAYNTDEKEEVAVGVGVKTLRRSFLNTFLSCIAVVGEEVVVLKL
jgi:hypothetical protein